MNINYATCSLLNLTSFTEHSVFEIHPCCCHFLLLDNFPLYGYTCLFIHSQIDGHLGCLQLETVMNMPDMDIHLQIFMTNLSFSVLLGKYVGVNLLDYIKFFFFFWFLGFLNKHSKINKSLTMQLHAIFTMQLNMCMIYIYIIDIFYMHIYIYIK